MRAGYLSMSKRLWNIKYRIRPTIPNPYYHSVISSFRFVISFHDFVILSNTVSPILARARCDYRTKVSVLATRLSTLTRQKAGGWLICKCPLAYHIHHIISYFFFSLWGFVPIDCSCSSFLFLSGCNAYWLLLNPPLCCKCIQCGCEGGFCSRGSIYIFRVSLLIGPCRTCGIGDWLYI